MSRNFDIVFEKLRDEQLRDERLQGEQLRDEQGDRGFSTILATSMEIAKMDNEIKTIQETVSEIKAIQDYINSCSGGDVITYSGS